MSKVHLLDSERSTSERSVTCCGIRGGWLMHGLVGHPLGFQNENGGKNVDVQTAIKSDQVNCIKCMQVYTS